MGYPVFMNVLQTGGNIINDIYDWLPVEFFVVDVLCKRGRRLNPGGVLFPHVVEVRRHGWLPQNSSYYYYDMEYCSESLGNRVHGAEEIFISPWLTELRNRISLVIDLFSCKT